LGEDCCGGEQNDSCNVENFHRNLLGVSSRAGGCPPSRFSKAGKHQPWPGNFSFKRLQPLRIELHRYCSGYTGPSPRSEENVHLLCAVT